MANLVDVDFRFDVLRLLAKVKSVDRLLVVAQRLGHCADNCRLRVATETGLQDSRHLAISIVDEGLAISLAQLVDDIGEGEKRPVYVTALSESQSVGMGFAHSFRASQVNEVKLRNLDLANCCALALNVDAKDGVTAT